MFGRSRSEQEPARSDEDTQAFSTAFRRGASAPERTGDEGSTAAYPVVGGDPDARYADDAPPDPDRSRRDRFGGINWGAGFFGWLVALAVTLLLAGVVGGVAAGTGADEELLPAASDAELGLAAVLTLAAVLLVGYYAGGYVAGRMSRYDGPRQGFAVWLVGLLVSVATVVAGAMLGAEYNLLEQVEMPSIPLSADELTTGGIVAAAGILLGTLLAAVAGGAVGRHYHARVDRWV